jgi:anti-sigma B factor antagonist
MTSQWEETQPARDATPAHPAFQIILAGEVDLDRKDELSALADQFAAGGQSNVEVDLSHVTFVDSTGIGFIVRLHATAMARGGTVCLVRPPASCRRVLQVTAVDQMVTIVEDPQS